MIGAPLSKEAPFGSGGALYRCGYNKRQGYGCAVVKNADVKEGNFKSYISKMTSSFLKKDLVFTAMTFSA